MTKKTPSRLARDRRSVPKRENIASITVDEKRKQILITTKDMLINQLHRDGPRIAKSFDRLAQLHIADCSYVLGRVQGVLIQHLPRLDDNGFEATASRLLYSATTSYIASIEVARHGFPRQYGAVAIVMIETLATVLILATKKGALETLHAGKLESAKCVGWSKSVLPPIAQYWGMLSNSFVHIGTGHARFEGIAKYLDKDDDALIFVVSTLRGNIWLLDIVTDLVFSSENTDRRYWARNGQEAKFDPTPEVNEWVDQFFSSVT
jgi:hypothetical protein